jgi:PAS domain S-box-containing protein
MSAESASGLSPTAEEAAGYLRARALYSITRLDSFTQPANISAAILICVVSWQILPPSLLVIWAFAITSMAVMRMALAWRFLRYGPPLTATIGDVRQIIWHTFATSTLYAVMLVYLVPHVGQAELLVVVGVITGLIAAGALAIATIPRAVIIWVGILCAGSYYAMATNPYSPQTWQLSAFLALYAITITICAVFVSRFLLTSDVEATTARARLIDAIESLSDGFMLWDKDRQPVLANSVAQSIAEELKNLDLPRPVSATSHEPLEIRVADGRWFAIHERATRDGGVVAIYSDITERKRAEEATADAGRRYQTILQTASDGMHVVDEDGYLVEASASFLRELGYPEQPLPRLNVADWDAGIKREDVGRIIKTRIGMPPGLFETQHRRRDSSVYDAEVSVQLVIFDNRKYLYCSARNITERKRAIEERSALERQLQQSLKMEAVGQLTGGVAHDFNNLLAVLLGRLQLIETELQDNSVVRDWVRACIKTVDRGATLTRSLLAFSRRQPLLPVELDLNAAVRDMTEIMKRTLGEGIEIQLVQIPGLWHCEADPGQLQNALLNLALNARDAMPDGGKLIVESNNARLDADYATSYPEVKPGDYVMLAVSDTGTGMSREVLDHVFEPFFTTKETGKGSGLGLSMVYGFVNQSGGHINIYSEIGRGTTVRIYLPRKLDPTGAVVTELEAERVLTPGHETVLLVEDNVDLRGVTRLQLQRLGYTVIVAGDAAGGLALLQAHNETSLLLTDIVLPGGVDGFLLAEQAKAMQPAINVMFMTGYTEHRALEGLGIAQARRILHKPFHSEELAAMIRSVLDPT